MARWAATAEFESHGRFPHPSILTEQWLCDARASYWRVCAGKVRLLCRVGIGLQCLHSSSYEERHFGSITTILFLLQPRPRTCRGGFPVCNVGVFVTSRFPKTGMGTQRYPSRDCSSPGARGPTRQQQPWRSNAAIRGSRTGSQSFRSQSDLCVAFHGSTLLVTSFFAYL